jgi:predicted DCC family thiol-disulfide oxidoreductase YuxK
MTINHSGSEAVTVFFDGQCPLCTREIGFYQQQEGSRAINWVDVAKVNLSDLPPGLTQESALSRFHVVTAKGTLVSGGEAFSSLWLSLPKFNWVGQLFQITLLATILEVVYKIFLPCRPLLQRFLRQTLRKIDKKPKTYKTKR